MNTFAIVDNMLLGIVQMHPFFILMEEILEKKRIN